MNKLLYSLIVTASLIISGCQGNDKQKGKLKEMEDMVKRTPGANAGTGTFTIEAPDGWSKQDTTMMGLQAVVMMSEAEGAGDSFRENINVITEKTGDMSIKKYMELNEKNFSRMLTNYKPAGTRQVTIDETPAIWTNYSHSIYGNDIDVSSVLLIKNGIAYIITCSAEGGTINKWKPLFDKAIESFHVN